MIPAKINAIPITTIREKALESIADWFDLHKQSFYTLGWCYLRNQQQMDELFYRSIIKVQKELSRFKNETSFELWVTSIFIQTCRELSDDQSLQADEESEPLQDFFKALDHLNEYEKEAMFLTYVKGFSKEEVAQLLQVSVEKIKELLFSGIYSFRKEMGYKSAFHGCKEYHKDYIDYLEKNLERSKKINFEVHIFQCKNCQEDLATFQDVMLTMLNLTEKIENLRMPSGFMENVKERLAEQEKHRQQKRKKRRRKGLIFAGAFALLTSIGFFTGAFSYLYYTWTEEDQELRTFLQQDLGERLDLEAESDGVKIKIKSAIADDVQTLVFYEIEDTNEDNQFVMNYDDGVLVENEHEIMNSEKFPRYYLPDLKSDVNNEKKNVYYGKMGLPPLRKDNGTIKFKITKLQKLSRDSSKRNSLNVYENMGYETGEWNFEIPVTKYPSTEYSLDKEIEVEGIPVRFDKIIVAPTATTLQYSINREYSKKRIESLNFDHLEVNNKKVKADRYGSYGSSFYDSQQDMNWNTFQTHFDPFFGKKPKEVRIQLGSIYLTIEDPKTIKLDASQEYPQTFEYAGSAISIDKVEVGLPSNVVISNHEIENRAYESLQYQVIGEDENNANSTEMEMGIDSEGVLVDKNGIQYDENEIPDAYEEVEQPRYFITVERIRLQNNNSGEKVIPKKLEIYGYNTTKYLDDVVKIPLK
ncbi:sigma-70 family RNA polymerase sigma factor [Cytobacillus sp. Hz8]|uniref:sigma-70 family RNA polymerase sigma factor n=1 Tax=Cytobacillus sp. Hz8 TaxID=3347168 RepID=UPI0035DFBE5F